MQKLHAGSGIPHGTLHRGTDKKPSPYHHGSSKSLGVLHSPPAAGGAVNRGGTFGMGTIKKGKRK
jgi:hypothetical protein